MSIARKIIRYAVVGVIGTAVHFGILALLVELFHIEPVTSSTAGFIVTVIVSYVLNHKWTFRSDRGHRSALPRYVIVSITGMFLNSGIMYLTVHIFGWWYILGQSLVVVAVPITNFVLNYRWSFRPAG